MQPDVVLLWDRRALSRYPGADATRVGVLSDYAGFGHWRRCRHLLALSEDLVQAACERGWPPERVERAPLFLPDEPVPASSPGALAGWTNKDLVLATPFAAGDPGARLLLEAVAPMPSICLWIPAAQRDHRRLRAAIARAGMAERAVLLAPEQVSAGLYAAADLVVAAGQQDDIGLGVVQAWAAGKPVVGAGGLGPAALIRHGDNGFLCSRGNATALRSALLRLLDDPLRCDRLALAGRRTFLQHHREARGVESWFDALRKAHHIPDARDAAHAPVHWSVRA